MELHALGGAVANYGVADPIGGYDADRRQRPVQSLLLLQRHAHRRRAADAVRGPADRLLQSPRHRLDRPDRVDSRRHAAGGQTYSLTGRTGRPATNDWADVNYAIGLATTRAARPGHAGHAHDESRRGQHVRTSRSVTYTLNVNAQAAAFVGQDASIVIRANNGFTGGLSPPDFVQANFDNVRLSRHVRRREPGQRPRADDRSRHRRRHAQQGRTHELQHHRLLDHLQHARLAQPGQLGPRSPSPTTTRATARSTRTTIGPFSRRPNDTTDLSEAELEGGNGGVLDHRARRSTSARRWIKTPLQDVQAQLLLVGGTNSSCRSPTRAPRSPPATSTAARPSTRPTGRSSRRGRAPASRACRPRERYQLGDLNNDGKHDLADFSAFRSAYDAANGVGSFAAMVAGVPEPDVGDAAEPWGGGRTDPTPSPLAAASGSNIAHSVRWAALGDARAGSCGCDLERPVPRPSRQSPIGRSTRPTPRLSAATSWPTIADDSGLHNATGVFNGTTTITPVAGQFWRGGLFTNGLGTQAANNAYYSFPQLTEIAGPSAATSPFRHGSRPTNVTNTNNILADVGRSRQFHLLVQPGQPGHQCE